MAIKLARAFPEETVHVKLKASKAYLDRLIRPGCFEEFNARFADAPSNLSIVEGSSLDYILRAKYVISTFSTTLIEGILLGRRVYFLDFYDPRAQIFFRDFPEISLRSAEDAVATLRQIEVGEQDYPWNALAPLRNESLVPIFSRLREEFGQIPANEARFAVRAAGPGTHSPVEF